MEWKKGSQNNEKPAAEGTKKISKRQAESKVVAEAAKKSVKRQTEIEDRPSAKRMKKSPEQSYIITGSEEKTGGKKEQDQRSQIRIRRTLPTEKGRKEEKVTVQKNAPEVQGKEDNVAIRKKEGSEKVLLQGSARKKYRQKKN